MGMTIVGPDGKPRCRWCGATPEFLAYYDTEWGFPVRDDHRLFEKMCLVGFQSGLSWRTIFAKRENFRAAFHNFKFNRIAGYTQQDLDRLLNDKGIVRHRGKIEAVINNAKRAQELVKLEGSLAAFIWRYEPSIDQLDCNDQRSIACTVERTENTRMEIYRTNYYVCLHASNRADQRSC
ncbi:DNA-3-methyladenine glycosylase I [Cohnella lupini]|uniref:DNA-3-methyladenine glycosylase I n=1 Tax=Cohnella lupini TaxID=1294267 RepID=A0A3D9HU31_9BACL|nr:DNA-3-methyladenine glycosylase I [Cohnella lupini]